MRYLYFLFFIGLAIGCKQDTKGIVSPEHDSETASGSRFPVVATMVDSTNFIQNFLGYIEASQCKNYEDDTERCYILHEAAMRSDFVNETPITLNFPYNATMDWSGIKDVDGFSDFWSGKCGFQVAAGEVINFMCPNISAKAKEWLKAIQYKSPLIQEFYKEYTETQKISPLLQEAFILRAQNELDFKDVDMRAFYWFYHLTLAEERQAFTKVKIAQAMKQAAEG